MPRKNYLSRRPARLAVTADADTVALLAAEHLVAKAMADAVDVRSDDNLSPALRDAARRGLAARFTNGEDNLAWPASREAIATELAHIGVPVSLAEDLAGRLVGSHRLRDAAELIDDATAANSIVARLGGSGLRVKGVAVTGRPVEADAPVADTTLPQAENPELDAAEVIEEVRPNRRRRHAVEELV